MNSVLSFLSLLGKGLFSVIKWLLFKLGLWVPAVFSVLFWLVVLVTGTEFSDVVGVYIFGLCATVLFAVAIRFCLFPETGAGKPRKNALRRLCRKLNRRKKGVSFVEGAPGKRRKPHPSDQADFTSGRQEEKPLFPGGIRTSESSEAALREDPAMESAYDSNESRLDKRGFFDGAEKTVADVR